VGGASQLPDFLNRSIQRCRIPGSDCQVRTFPRERDGDGSTNSSARAGDQRFLSFKTHCNFFSRTVPGRWLFRCILVTYENPPFPLTLEPKGFEGEGVFSPVTSVVWQILPCEQLWPTSPVAQ